MIPINSSPAQIKALVIMTWMVLALWGLDLQCVEGADCRLVPIRILQDSLRQPEAQTQEHLSVKNSCLLYQQELKHSQDSYCHSRVCNTNVTRTETKIEIKIKKLG